MAKPKTVVDLLAEQPDEALHAMREVNRRELARAQEEVSRLRVEAAQIEQALKRGNPPGGRVTGDEVLDAATRADDQFSAADVKAILADLGRDAHINAVRNHLNRLVTDRKVLEKHSDGRYSVKSPGDFPAAAADDDIPF